MNFQNSRKFLTLLTSGCRNHHNYSYSHETNVYDRVYLHFEANQIGLLMMACKM